MNEAERHVIIEEFHEHVKNKEFPCIAAHEASSKKTLRCFVADHMACPKDDHQILNFIYAFVDEFKLSSGGFHSVVIIFKEPRILDENMFDHLLWRRLQAISDMDAQRFDFDSRVSSDIGSPNFSYSLKEEAFYVIGLHPASSRKARQYKYPVLIFNPHSQFENLRAENHYSKMQQIVRKRDQLYSGSVNPMLADFGDAPEVFQYSGRVYESTWQCPLKINHANIKHHSSA
ncbi:MAG TPA: guanitoxin biosynthesis heme-dependent pre-guanitoxin N-hydroxylase GntA [Saprospiraceae bacterium]|nr:guanitoxin biosynthesis heme-dependent pre-guanitoxin N-hydroxylase GntA [Saprospiraceae bacterium]